MGQGGLYLPILSPSHFDYSIYSQLASRLKTDDLRCKRKSLYYRIETVTERVQGVKEGG
jgi:hypothetical protein